MYEVSRERHTRPSQYGETRTGLGSQTNGIKKTPVVEISSSANTFRSWGSFPSSPHKLSAHTSNTHKRLTSHSPKEHPNIKRIKPNAPSTITVEPAPKAAFTARLTKSSAVYLLDEENTPDYKDELPKSIREKLERWYTRYGRGVPPCASMTHIQPSRGDGTCEWSHVPTGERLHISVYTMNKANDPRPSQGNPKRLIIAQGGTQGPFIIQFFDSRTRPKNIRASRFRIWHGVDSGSALFAGDKDGFEHWPSVAKMTFQRGEGVDSETEDAEDEDEGEDEDEDPISAQVPRSRRGIGQPHGVPVMSRPSPNIRPGPSRTQNEVQNPPTADTAPAVRIERSPGCSGVLKRPKKFEALCTGQASPRSPNNCSDPARPMPPLSNLTSSSSNPRPRPDPSSSHPHPTHHYPPTPQGHALTDSLSTYIRANAEFWFLPLHNLHPPRIRPYPTCCTAKTLFGHARSARVFDPSPEIANVLTIRTWDDAEAMTLMEEDDPMFREMDYQALLEGLREARCWIWIDGEWTGSCTVEVKVME